MQDLPFYLKTIFLQRMPFMFFPGIQWYCLKIFSLIIKRASTSLMNRMRIQMRWWFFANAPRLLYNYSLLLKAHFVLKCYERASVSPHPSLAACQWHSPSFLGAQGKYRLPLILRMGGGSEGCGYKEGAWVHVSQLVCINSHFFFFLKCSFSFGIILYLQRGCKDNSQSSVYSSPTFP